MRKKVRRLAVFSFCIFGLFTSAATFFATSYLVTNFISGTWLTCALALTPALLVGVFLWLYGVAKFSSATADKEHIRGRKLLTYKQAKKKSAELCKGKETIFWGGLTLPLSAVTSHFAFVGATGSGKRFSFVC